MMDPARKDRSDISNDSRHVPVRTCVGCGKKQEKCLFHRLTLNAQGQPCSDPSQTAAGRGAYLCGEGCLKAAVRRKAFVRAFRRNIENLNVPILEAVLC